MSIPTPRFEIGQTVFAVEAEDEAVLATCPDCADTRVWQATSPAGEKFDFPCPRCTNGDVWKLKHQKAVAKVRKLTIGSVRLDSGDINRPVSYMCHETGIGSGTIWYEQRLAAGEDEIAVLSRAAIADREVWRATELNRREINSGWGSGGMRHRLEVALRHHSWQTAQIATAKSEAWSQSYRYELLCNAIAELDEYGGIEGLDALTLDRIVKHLADTAPQVGDARDAVMHDRETARKAA